MSRDLSDYQEQYSKQPYEKYQVAFRKRKILDILLRYKHDILLEVGCGLESIFLDLNSFTKLSVIEPAQMFYDKAIADAKKINLANVTFINKLLEDAENELNNMGFDFILVSSLLHEIPNQPKFLATLRSICNQNTIVHINVPNAKSFHRVLAVEMGLIKSEFEMSASNIQFQQQTVFDLPTLSKMVEQAGFAIVESGSYSFKPFTHKQMQNIIDKGDITEAMLDGFYRMEKYIPGLGSEIFVNIRKN